MRDQTLLQRARRIRGDHGVTLVEMLVTMVIFSIVLTMVYAVLITVQRQTKQTMDRADAVGEARLALQHIDRQVRSGNVLTEPVWDAATDSYYMRIYTQANGPQRCVQWQVDTVDDVLRTRSWNPGDVPADDWAVVARHVVNSPSEPAFDRPGGPYGNRLIDVTLVVDEAPGAGAPPIDVVSSLSGRNTSYGYDEAICN